MGTAAAAPAAGRGAVLRITASALALLAAGAMGVVVLRIFTFDTGQRGLWVGLVLAVLPVPFYVGLALWLDRFETEPLWMLAAAFVWGATAAPLIALLANRAIGSAVAARIPGLDELGAQTFLAAPFVEELAKGAILLVLFVWRNKDFDGLIDGVVYACMVALGFAMTENVLYFGRELAEHGPRAVALLALERDLFFPLIHPLFTGLLGVALGLAVHVRRRRERVPLIAAGLAMSMATHLAWNLSTQNLGLLLPAYAVLAALIAGVGLLVAASLRHESRTLHARLKPYVGLGGLTVREHHRLASPRRRLAATMHCLLRRGPRSAWACVRFHQAACELAFHRLRDATGREKLTPEVESDYLRQIAVLRAQTGLAMR